MAETILLDLLDRVQERFGEDDCQLLDVLLEPGEVVEGPDASALAGVDQDAGQRA